MKIAVIGSSGLIGNDVAERLRASYPVLTVARTSNADRQIDITNLGSIESFDFDGCDTVIHCAGIVDEDFVDTGRAFHQATQGMTYLVRRAKASGVNRFVYISSAHVYGALKGTLNENSVPNPLHDYAIAHFASEQILRRFAAPDFKALAIRPCAVFGIPPDLARFRRWALIPFGFPKAAVDTSAITLATHGVQLRNFVGTSDIAATIDRWLCLPEPSTPFLVANAVGKETISVRSFADLCADIASRETGHACTVVTPSGEGPIAESFEYSTVHEWNDFTRTDLKAVVETLTALLIEEASGESA